jgi:hypothetical protein
MRMLAAAAALPLLLSGCTADPPETDASAPRTLAAGQVACIDLTNAASRRPDPPRHIVFEIGARTYRNEVVGTCPGLARATPASVVAFELVGSNQLCRDDSVRVYDPVEAGAVGLESIPRCRLGAFTEVR